MMSDKEFLLKIADLWLELDGDAEGLLYTWRQLYEIIKAKEQIND